MSATGARIAPLPIDGWDDDAVAALRAAFGEDAAERLLSTEAGGARAPNVLPTVLRPPPLTGPFLACNALPLHAPLIQPPPPEPLMLRPARRSPPPRAEG